MSADSSHFRLAEASVRLDSMPAGGRDEVGRGRIEIADPEFRQGAETFRMPHAAICRDDARTGHVRAKARRHRERAPEKDDEFRVCRYRHGHG